MVWRLESFEVFFRMHMDTGHVLGAYPLGVFFVYGYLGALLFT